jgi:hypothetical protein
MKQALKYNADSLYLDQQPELQGVLKDWLQGLDLDAGGVAYDKPRLEEIECRSRDGFIRASHNFGGFDLEYLTEVHTCHGSGCGPNLSAIERHVDWAYQASKEFFKEQESAELVGIPDDKIDYHSLYELGRGDLAERLSEIEREHMDTSVYWGVRAMYEGVDSRGVHTLMLYASGNVNEYYGFCGNGSTELGEWTVRFKTASGLRRQLERLTKKVEQVF